MIWRVRGHETFRALAGARSIRAGPIALRYHPGSGESAPPAVAYAVGRAVGSAVVRNRLRRRLRSIVAEQEASLRPGATYLVSAGRGAVSMSRRDLEAAIIGVLQRARKPS